MDLRTPLAKAKGLGAAKHGVHHWWMQRLSAVALVPLVIWFVYSVVNAVVQPIGIIHMLYSPVHAVMMILFITTALYHGCLGMQMIYEDYISCPCALLFMKTVTNFVSIVLAVATVLAVVYIHVASFSSTNGAPRANGYSINHSKISLNFNDLTQK
jgi:succinate dehydrogenase / fumarate reductase membrane anchor subunit